MGIRFSAVVDVAGVAAGAAYVELLAAATRSIDVHVVKIDAKDALGSLVGLVRSATVGTGNAFGTGIAHRALVGTAPIGTALARVHVGFAVTPSAMASRLRDAVIAGGTTGTSRHLWSSDVDGPITIEPGQSLLVINQASAPSAATLKIGLTWAEGDASAR